jgi:hypothetical protein
MLFGLGKAGKKSEKRRNEKDRGYIILYICNTKHDDDDDDDEGCLKQKRRADGKEKLFFACCFFSLPLCSLL